MASIDLIIKDKSKIDSVLSHARGLIERAIVAGVVVVTLGRPTGTRAQEEKYHAMINDISRTVEFFAMDENGEIIPGVMIKHKPDVLKAKFVHAFEKELNSQGIKLRKPSRKTMSLDGTEVITIRASTTGFNTAQRAMFIEYLYQQGSELGATFSEKSLAYYDEVKK